MHAVLAAAADASPKDLVYAVRPVLLDGCKVGWHLAAWAFCYRWDLGDKLCALHGCQFCMQCLRQCHTQ
jgi:hypothetical protein